jgi:hypothetical protein
MPTNIKIIHAHDFIKTTPDGILNLEKSKNLIVEIASVSTNLSDFDLIVDTRKTQVEMSPTNLWYLAQELSNLRLRKPIWKRTAILCPLEGFDFAEFFALCSQNRGLQVNAFTSFEDAIEWLSGTWQDYPTV